MDRAYQSGAAVSAPSAPASPSTGYPTAGNPGSGTPATTPGPYWYHMIMEELMAVISAAGIEPAQGNLTQLLTALRSAGVFQTAPQFDNDTSVATTAFVQRALGNRQGYNVPAAGSSFSAADAGKAFGLNGPSTYTLSSASGLPNGATFDFFAAGNGCVVQASGSDTITTKGGATVTSLTLNLGDTLSLLRVGPTAWLAISGSAQLKFAEVFGSSIAAGGYQKLPSGLIIQWGVGAITNGTDGKSYTVTYPIAFPTACRSVTAQITNSPNNSNYSGNLVTSLTGYTAWVFDRNGAGVVGGQIYWTAIGH